MRKVFTLAVGLAVTGWCASPAAADWLDFGESCAATGSVRTCAAFQAKALTYTVGSTTRTQLYLRVRNLYSFVGSAQGGSALTRFGILAPELGDVVRGDWFGGDEIRIEGGAGLVGDPAGFWDFRSSLNSLNPDGSGVEWGLATRNARGGIQDCIGPAANPPDYYRTCVGAAPAGWVTFAMSSAGVVDPGDVRFGWAVVSQSITEGSYEGVSCVGRECGTEVVPEPVTLVLLGTGLLGLAVAARCRREDGET